MSHLVFLKICISCSVTPPHQRNIARERLGIDTAHGHSPSKLPMGSPKKTPRGIQCTSIDACSSPEFVEEGWFSSISQSIRFPTTEWSTPLDTTTARACPPGLNGSTTMDSVPLISARQNGQPPPPSES